MYGDCGRYNTGILHEPSLLFRPVDNGRRTTPVRAGQMPAITRSSELLPEPFFPVMIVCIPLKDQRNHISAVSHVLRPV